MAKLKPPLKSAPKVDWVAYAIELHDRGDPRGLPSYEAWALTVEELVDKYAEPDPPAAPAPPARARSSAGGRQRRSAAAKPTATTAPKVKES